MLAESSPISDIQVLKELDNRFFLTKARPAQIPPLYTASGALWQYWMLKAGRGYGKTIVGGEWSIGKAREFPGCRIALVAQTAADARDVMVEGDSGILTISKENFMPLYEPSKRRLTWPNGTIGTLYSAEEPKRLRGPQHHFAWADELAFWKYIETWDMLMFGLRLGQNPQVVITTTPRPIPIIKELVKDPACVVTGGSSYENRENLAPSYFEKIIKKYEGTRLGRQELNAEILDDNPNAKWTRALIEEQRIGPNDKVPPLIRVVVGVDPAVSDPKETEEKSAETGIIAAGISAEGHGYVLEDTSLAGSAVEWARAVVRSFNGNKGDRVVGEINNGGYLVEVNLRTVDRNIPFTSVHASRGKEIRAEPVSSLYEQGKIHHVGTFPQLEDQMCEWEPGQKSPDRMDAMVWAFWDLFRLEKTNAGGSFRAAGRKMVSRVS